MSNEYTFLAFSAQSFDNGFCDKIPFSIKAVYCTITGRNLSTFKIPKHNVHAARKKILMKLFPKDLFKWADINFFTGQQTNSEQSGAEYKFIKAVFDGYIPPSTPLGLFYTFLAIETLPNRLEDTYNYLLTKQNDTFFENIAPYDALKSLLKIFRDYQEYWGQSILQCIQKAEELLCNCTDLNWDTICRVLTAICFISINCLLVKDTNSMSGLKLSLTELPRTILQFLSAPQTNLPASSLKIIIEAQDPGIQLLEPQINSQRTQETIEQQIDSLADSFASKETLSPSDFRHLHRFVRENKVALLQSLKLRIDDRQIESYTENPKGQLYIMYIILIALMDELIDCLVNNPAIRRELQDAQEYYKAQLNPELSQDLSTSSRT